MVQDDTACEVMRDVVIGGGGRTRAAMEGRTAAMAKQVAAG